VIKDADRFRVDKLLDRSELILGEPGLGKSRLIEEFHARLKDVPHTWTEWSCSQLLQNTPLHPVAEWGRQSC
jgi:predicted ATPase